MGERGQWTAFKLRHIRSYYEQKIYMVRTGRLEREHVHVLVVFLGWILLIQLQVRYREHFCFSQKTSSYVLRTLCERTRLSTTVEKIMCIQCNVFPGEQVKAKSLRFSMKTLNSSNNVPKKLHVLIWIVEIASLKDEFDCKKQYKDLKNSAFTLIKDVSFLWLVKVNKGTAIKLNTIKHCLCLMVLKSAHQQLWSSLTFYI